VSTFRPGRKNSFFGVTNEILLRHTTQEIYRLLPRLKLYFPILFLYSKHLIFLQIKNPVELVCNTKLFFCFFSN
jgi:hypothetical protein